MPSTSPERETPETAAPPPPAETPAQEPSHDAFRAPIEPPVDGAQLNQAQREGHQAALAYLARCANLLRSNRADKTAAIRAETAALPPFWGQESLAAARATVAFCLNLLESGGDTERCLARIEAEAASIRRAQSLWGEGGDLK